MAEVDRRVLIKLSFMCTTNCIKSQNFGNEYALLQYVNFEGDQILRMYLVN